MDIRSPVWLTGRLWLTISLRITVSHSLFHLHLLTSLSPAHIATVGNAMLSSEEVAYPILRKHNVDYVLVIIGGLLGYARFLARRDTGTQLFHPSGRIQSR